MAKRAAKKAKAVAKPAAKKPQVKKRAKSASTPPPPPPTTPAETSELSATGILGQLKALGLASYKKVMLNHGITEPVFGVKIEEMKKILKRTGSNYPLALELFESGVYDARYLAGLMTDAAKMTKRDLERWVNDAKTPATCYSIVSAVAAESRFGAELARKWVDARTAAIAATGWATWSSLVSIRPDSELDLDELKKLLARVEQTIFDAPNGVRYAMNNFVIAVGCYVAPLTDLARQTAERIGQVEVDMGRTECKVPSAVEYIDKVKARGTIGKKRKKARC